MVTGKASSQISSHSGSGVHATHTPGAGTGLLWVLMLALGASLALLVIDALIPYLNGYASVGLTINHPPLIRA